MTQFHQQGQHVTGQQNNAGGDLSISTQQLAAGAAHTPADLATLLSQLQSTVVQATHDGTLPKKQGILARHALEHAVIEAEEPTPDKKGILDHLTTAKTLIESVAAASALVPAVIAAIDAVHKVFG